MTQDDVLKAAALINRRSALLARVDWLGVENATPTTITVDLSIVTEEKGKTKTTYTKVSFDALPDMKAALMASLAAEAARIQAQFVELGVEEVQK